MHSPLFGKNVLTLGLILSTLSISVFASPLREINANLKRIETLNKEEKIQIWLADRERPDLIIGETFKFNASSPDDGYLTFFYVDQNGDSAVMDVGLPTSQTDGRFNYSFPNNGSLPVEKPIGRSLVYAYVTHQRPALAQIGLVKDQALAGLKDPIQDSERFATLVQRDGPTLAKGRLSFFVQESTQDGSFKTKLISQILLADSTPITSSNKTSGESDSDNTVVQGATRNSEIPEENLLLSAKKIAEANNTTFDFPIYFAYNSAELTPVSQNMLLELWQGPLSDNRIKHKLMIIGHTDSTGPADYNMNLSKQRAQAVKEHLETKHSVPAERIVARGRGELEPAAPNMTASNRELNRRVEFVFMLP